jgi:hypothetical protein
MFPGHEMVANPPFVNRVRSTDLAGDVRTEVEMTDDEPSGLGWLPDGRLLVVAMESQLLRRVERDGTLPLHAGLSAIARGSFNNMIVVS